MIDINDFKQFFDYVSNKNGRGNYVSAAKFNRLVQRALTSWIESMYDNHREYQIGMKLSKVQYESTQAVIDRLSYLKERVNLKVTSGSFQLPNGKDVKDILGNIPPQYKHHSSLRIYYKRKKKCGDIKASIRDCKIVTDDELAERLDSAIVAPSYKYPIATFYNGFVDVYPKEATQVDFTYLREPKAPVWNFDIVDGRPVYNKVGSVDIDAPEIAYNEILVRALGFLGINMRDDKLLSYSEEMKRQGI